MDRFEIFFLAFLCIFGGVVTMSFENGDKSRNENFLRVPLRPLVQSRVRRADGPASSRNSLQYTKDKRYGLPISVGTPAQSFVLMLDTGSAVIWMPSKDCGESDSYLCKANRKFDTNASSTYKPFTENPKFTIDYIGGELTGQRAYETVSIGDLKITDQEVGVATIETANANADPYDGFVGFPHSQVNPDNPKKTILDNLYEQNQISQRLACLKLKEDGGELLLGGCDVEAESWAPIKPPHWRVNITKVVVTSNGSPVSTLCGDSKAPCLQGVFDSGDIGLTIPGSLWESFAESIGADKNNRLLLCDKADPISIEFYIGDVKLVYASKDFIDPYFLSQCRVSSVHLEYFAGQEQFLFGDTMLRKFTLFMDKDNDRVGFANIREN